MQDGEAEAGELRHGFDAVFGEAAKGVKAVESGDRQGDGGLEGDDTHAVMVVGLEQFGNTVISWVAEKAVFVGRKRRQHPLSGLYLYRNWSRVD